MKKIILSLVTLMIIGTSTGYCKTNSMSHNGNQPKKELVVKNQKDSKHCNCPECKKHQKSKKPQPPKHQGKHMPQPSKPHHGTPHRR